MESEKLMPCPRELRHRTHGYCADYPNLFGVWLSMKNRCKNPNRKKYKDYGARGISVCAEWENAGAFCSWALANGYNDGLQIDRINNDGIYEPSNCRWVTPKQNSRNRRNTVYLEIGEEVKCVSEWAELTGISPYTIYWWIKRFGKDGAVKKIQNRRSADDHK